MIAASLAAVASQAQTTTLFDGAVYLPSGFKTIDFSVGGTPESFTTFIEGAAIFNASDEGIGILSGPDGYYEKFALTDTVTDAPVFNTFELTQKGSYSFTYNFASNKATYGDEVALTATITAVPEPRTLAMIFAGLVVAGLAARRSRRVTHCMSEALAA